MYVSYYRTLNKIDYFTDSKKRYISSLPPDLRVLNLIPQVINKRISLKSTNLSNNDWFNQFTNLLRRDTYYGAKLQIIFNIRGLPA